MFLVDTQHTSKVKQLIWAIFIYLRCKLLKLSTNFLEKLHLLFKVFTVIINKVPLMYFPSSLGINAMNKCEVIQAKLSEKTQTNMHSFNYEPIIQSLPSDLVFNENKIDIDAITIHIEKFYSLYATEYLNRDIMFDERILLSDLFKTDSSPVKMSLFSNMKDNLKCAKCLFFEPQIGAKSISSNDGNPFKFFLANTPSTIVSPNVNQTPIDMTPCTRAVSLNNWAKTYIANFDGKHILQLQDKYVPAYSYNPSLKPVDMYIKSQFQIFEKQLNVYKFRIITTFPDIEKMCLKLITLLFQKDLMIFTEEFVAMLLYNEEFIKAMIAISIEIILFVEDIQEISFYKIPELLGVDVYDLWKVLNPTRFPSFTFHKEIKEHLEEIEYQIVSFLIWRRPSTKLMSEIKYFFHSEQNDNQCLNVLADFEYKTQSLFMFHRKEDYELNYENKKSPSTMDIYTDIRHLLHKYKHLQGIAVFFRRVVNYSNLLNKNIFINIKHKKITHLAEVSEQFIKHIITNENAVELLYNKHIDQVIICCVMSILLMNNVFSFDHNTNNSDDSVFTLSNLRNIYIRSKPRQIPQVSEMIFEKVKVSDKKYSSLNEFYNTNFKVLFQEHIALMKQDICEGDELSEMPAVKKRKFSDSIVFCSKNTNQEALQNKSAFGNKVDNYIPFEKKNNLNLNDQFGFRNAFYGSYMNEFKSKRTQLLKELYSYLVKLDLDLSLNKQENPALRKLLVGLDRSGKSK